MARMPARGRGATAVCSGGAPRDACQARLVPMFRDFNETARYVDQGGGKRDSSFALYLDPWHGDVFDSLELKKNHG